MQIEYSPVFDGIYVVLNGRLTTLDIVNVFDELINFPEFKPGMNALWNVTQATHPDLSSEDIRVIATHIRRFAEKRGNGKTAWVVANDVDFGIGRMFEMMTDRDIPMTFRVFRDMVEAKLWIGSKHNENQPKVRVNQGNNSTTD